MKSKDDLVRGWLRKAQSDLATTGFCLSAGDALDVQACGAVTSVPAKVADHTF